MTHGDLSQHHRQLSAMFPKANTRALWEECKLSDEQLAFFEENGYLANIKLLEGGQVDQLNRELAEIMDPAHPLHHLFYEFHSNESEDANAVLFHSLGHWRLTEGFHDVLWNPRFVIPASQLFGNRAVRFWHDQLFCKPAHHGGVVAWHQDYSYWTRTTPMQHLTCWVALDDASKENGCLHYIPKSHRWNLLDRTSLAGTMDGLDKFLTDTQKEQFGNKVAIEMPRGYATFHHPLMVHGSYANHSPRSRRAFVLNVFADGTTSNTDDPVLSGVPPIAQGKKMEGQFFPLLFDPATLA
ncbi:phytanoyl-CoA dioxygenase family protein [Chryseolinea lacunae]|uniref:Phytanoyl-CoA dioxygenase family protein n=1 Tax=Chryseolinea lacunae TaxID=2801331 RepID=A0ABS1L276_9BACT|nr:phytanoyl-CoA dioxygenase family protein [Chryseolinea lacunae]MBL0745628.1 phytanoyl-CoA dioxygenase family protein [Chryseolinea lacunae]